MKKRSRLATAIAAGAVVLSVVLVASACAGGSASSNSSSDPAQTGSNNVRGTINFMLDWTPNTNHVGIYDAEAKNYYRDLGLTVNILPASQAGAENAVETGVADVGFTTLSNVAAFDAQGSHLEFVFDLTQKPVAQWCSLASRTDITTPKDFDGKTFVSFGSAEQDAVVTQMIKTAGGTGNFSRVTVGTSTFQTLTSGKGDFAGFYSTWEGVESTMNGPALKCFNAANWGVPGNPDQLGFAVSTKWLATGNHAQLLREFLAATIKGYQDALANPTQNWAAVFTGPGTTGLDLTLVKNSMEFIVKNALWTATNPSIAFGQTDFAQAQPYLNFLAKHGVYKNFAPVATQLATNAYLGKDTAPRATQK